MIYIAVIKFRRDREIIYPTPVQVKEIGGEFLSGFNSKFLIEEIGGEFLSGLNSKFLINT